LMRPFQKLREVCFGFKCTYGFCFHKTRLKDWSVKSTTDHMTTTQRNA
jgi:hypothetical protein